MWVAYVVGVWLFLRPVLLTTVFADDFINPFFQFPTTKLSPVEMIRFGWTGARGAGHINVIGQTIGAVLDTLWMLMMAVLGLRFSTIYAATKLLVYVLTAVSAAAFVREASAVLGRPISLWRSRLYVSVALFGTLQIHIAWSNDPVSSYPASGFATAAIGFLLLALALRSFRSGSLRRAWVTGIVGSAAVLYYEILVSAVVAIAPLALWAWWSGGDRSSRASMSRVLRLTAPMVAVPAVVAAVAKLTIGSSSVGYSGTEVALGGGFGKSFFNGIVSTLPGAGWQLTREFLAAPVGLHTTAVIILVVVASALAVAASTGRAAADAPPVAVSVPATLSVTDGVSDSPHMPTSASGHDRVVAALMLLTPVVFMLGAAITQTATQKVQDEAPRVGFVYNYYAIGSTAWAATLVIAVSLVPRSWRSNAVRAIASSVGIAFIVVQFMVNWNVTSKFNAGTYPSRQLLVTFSERRPEDQRCRALEGWAQGAWPDYYEEWMILGLQTAYEYFHDEQFCTGFVRPK